MQCRTRRIRVLRPINLPVRRDERRDGFPFDIAGWRGPGDRKQTLKEQSPGSAKFLSGW
jgi:hypothetical protein